MHPATNSIQVMTSPPVTAFKIIGVADILLKSENRAMKHKPPKTNIVQ